ncbi:uncharacterized protein LOC141905256 isoform X2 [Tubulanus polymorphus]|uniref:uncharacterized protein LOC141905256 isoform X2 n=1 Tax=Tubulanus polymorphus TaxID=672921 RepID=UPI003DA39552
MATRRKLNSVKTDSVPMDDNWGSGMPRIDQNTSGDSGSKKSFPSRNNSRNRRIPSLNDSETTSIDFRTNFGEATANYQKQSQEFPVSSRKGSACSHGGDLSRQHTHNQLQKSERVRGRQTSLLNRAPTMHREPIKLRKISSESNRKSTAAAAAAAASQQKHVNPIHALHREITREFTFTGYDIMKDVIPKARIPAPDELEKVHREQVYETMCKRLGTIPITVLKNRLSHDEIRLHCHEIGPKGAKALAVALLDQRNLTVLDLAEDHLQTDGVVYLSDMIENKVLLTELNLARNDIKTIGVKAICESLKDTESLKILDLSGNHLKDQDACYIAELIENNISIAEMRLSHNDFREIGGEFIGKALSHNDTILHLDLSWNHLRGRGAISIAEGLMENLGLKKLNVAWNGFAEDGCAAMMPALQKNKFLAELDLSNNRINPEGIGHLLKGLMSNTALCAIRLGKNPITPRIALQILQASVKLGPDSALYLIDLEDIVVDEEFISNLENIIKVKNIEVLHGPVIRKSNEKVHLRNKKFAQERRLTTALFEHMDKQGYRVVDMFHRLDKDKSNSLTRKELQQPFMENNVPVTENQLDEMMAELDTDNSGDVDLRPR